VTAAITDCTREGFERSNATRPGAIRSGIRAESYRWEGENAIIAPMDPTSARSNVSAPIRVTSRENAAETIPSPIVDRV